MVERAFRDRDGVRLLVATTTLAMGVNTPASTVVVVGLDHPNGDPYSVAEYKNMVGRAGRLGFSETGKSMVVCLSLADEYRFWTTYVKGEPEALRSRFLASDPLLLITRVLAAADKAKLPSMNDEQIVGFIQSSFGAFQQGQRPGARPVTKEALAGAFARLVAGDLIRREENGYRLTDLGRLAGEGGIAVESIIRLAGAFRAVPIADLDDACILAVTQLTVELDDVIFPVHRKSHQERERWQGALRRQLPHRLADTILEGDQATPARSGRPPFSCRSGAPICSASRRRFFNTCPGTTRPVRYGPLQIGHGTSLRRAFASPRSSAERTTPSWRKPLNDSLFNLSSAFRRSWSSLRGSRVPV